MGSAQQHIPIARPVNRWETPSGAPLKSTYLSSGAADAFSPTTSTSSLSAPSAYSRPTSSTASSPRGSRIVVCSVSQPDSGRPAASRRTATSTVGDVAELGDIDVDHRAGRCVLVSADRFPGDAVDAGEPVDAAPHQDRVHRRGGKTELAADLDRAQPATPSRCHDPFHQLGWCLRRHPVWSAGPIGHPAGPFGSVSGRPFPGCHGRDHEHLRRRGRGPAVLDDESGEAKTGARGQCSVNVGHEGLLACGAVS
jgi:hypothetical protein